MKQQQKEDRRGSRGRSKIEITRRGSSSCPPEKRRRRSTRITPPAGSGSKTKTRRVIEIRIK